MENLAYTLGFCGPIIAVLIAILVSLHQEEKSFLLKIKQKEIESKRLLHNTLRAIDMVVEEKNPHDNTGRLRDIVKKRPRGLLTRGLVWEETH